MCSKERSCALSCGGAPTPMTSPGERCQSYQSDGRTGVRVQEGGESNEKVVGVRWITEGRKGIIDQWGGTQRGCGTSSGRGNQRGGESTVKE